MAISPKGEALKAKNLEAQKAFTETQGISASVTPAVANIGGQPVETLGQKNARQQAEFATKMATPTPVAPVVAPTIPVDAINPSAPTVQMQADSAKIEPTAPVAPVSDTVVPATMKEVATAPKVETPKFMTDTQRREALGAVDQQASRDQMIANVGIMAKEDAGVLTDRAKFNAKTSYDTKPPEEKAILDSYFNANTPTTAGDIKKQLFAGVEIKDPKILNTPAYRQAKFEKDRLSRYTGMSSEQLFNEMKNGLPTVASEALRGTPAYTEAMAKYDNFKKIDNINQTSKFLVTGKSPEKDPLAELSAQLTSIFGQQDQTGSTAEAYRTFISQNPEITEPTKEYNTKMAQKKEFERAREAIVEDLKKKYAGEPLSTILAIAARDSKPINDQINTLNDSLTTLASDIKFKTDLATQEFGFYTEDQKAKSAKQAKLQDLLGGLAVSQFGRQQDQAFTRETQAQNQAFDIQKMDIAQKYQADRDTQNYLQDLQKMGISNVYDLQKMGASQDFQKELLALNQKYENSRSVRDFQNDIKKMGITFDLGRQGKALDLADNMAMEDYKASLDPDKAEKWEAVRQKATENSSLADLYGKNVGTYEGNRGYDLAGKMGDAIVAPPGARVVSVNSINADGTISSIKEGQGAMSIKDPGYGNSVVLQLPDGKFMRLSHLQEIGVNLGDTLAGGQLVGTRGNTGNVRGKNGETLTAEQLAQGRGAHVDVEISNDATFKGKSLLSQSDQLAYLKSVKPFSKGEVSTTITDSDIETFNNATFKPADIKDAETKAKYQQYVAEKNKIKTNKDVSMEEILRFSAGGKDLGAEEAKALSKFDQAIGQIGGLQESIKTMQTGPILGALRGMNPYDTPAQTLKAQLNSLIPNLARGVYGEVGVLTDADIVNYAKTIPNLTSTEDVNKAVLAMTLDTIAGGYKKQLRTLAASGRDVSGFVSLYDEIKGQADYLKAGLGMSNQNMTNADSEYLKSLGL